ncbi:PDR/VanB family oxidoreductase [Prescottella agglutinans]|uniref:Ferredoxin-NADP reductase n=1 Tax=Prescottella agglutinans TaxID=1644129 RepID=A0ABT6MAG9_9NOCA|nr:PDR/VanB family oxidoreductase [Prescottella agglutinans]MDH6280776.1 ferredoxin-NADP reductase [Prescottella agglutinans]
MGISATTDTTAIGHGRANLQFDGLARVVRRSEESQGVVSIELVSAEPDAELPVWEPGAHVDVTLDNGLVRQYSLSGDPGDRGVWRLGILREVDGRGGSKWIHDVLRSGDTIAVRGPRNNFPLVDSSRYIFLAGGIGITPILPMIREAARRGADWSLHYGGRTRSTMAFLDELAALDGGSGRVVVHPQDEEGILDLPGILGTPGEGTAVYCCGPVGLIDATERFSLSWQRGRLHVERFAASPSSVGSESNDAIEVVCDQSGVTLEVPPELSILEAVENAGLQVMSSCTEGICGSCETRVISGEPDHRDSLLTEEERESGETMLICVSRARTARLVLDL